MSRPSAWSTVWRNFVNSLTSKPSHKVKVYIGTDSFGNRYYELPNTRSTVKRGYEPPAGENPQPPSVEWGAWLRSTRRFPPTPEEIEFNKMKQQAQIRQDAETEKRAPKIGSTGRGAADVDRPKQFPTYDDIPPGSAPRDEKG